MKYIPKFKIHISVYKTLCFKKKFKNTVDFSALLINILNFQIIFNYRRINLNI